MDLFEYQGKQYFARYGIPVSPGGEAETVDQAMTVAEGLEFPLVVKAQVRVGGRGKAGGIQLADTLDEVRTHATNILGMDIKGHTVHRLWIERSSDIAKEYYVSFTLDRPNKVYTCYVEGDCDLAEINPLILTTDGVVRALDAKVTLDVNATYRHPEWEVWSATDTEDEREAMAKEKGLNYIGLDGSVGIIANGAGLAMSTLDVVQQAGGTAANFLDIGGGANADLMTAAMEVVNADPAVRSIFVNIFGGITRVDEVAKGIIEALRRVDITSPIVLRLDGTNAVEGRALLEPHLNAQLISEPTMLAAARRAVDLAAAPKEG